MFSLSSLLNSCIFYFAKGGNDCGALKTAHVGIALSDAEASIVSPFTSLDKTISSVVEVLREGRCALASALASYKFMILYGKLYPGRNSGFGGNTCQGSHLLIYCRSSWCSGTGSWFVIPHYSNRVVLGLHGRNLADFFRLHVAAFQCCVQTGAQPAHIFAFRFTDHGQRCRCVVHSLFLPPCGFRHIIWSRLVPVPQVEWKRHQQCTYHR